VDRRIDGIEYTSFQDSVKDGDLDEMYKQFRISIIAIRIRT
jgi:hypothetical protein